MTRLHVFIKVASDDAFELKAQALNNDSRLKAAGIAALKFATDKLYVAGGEFLTELPAQETPAAPSNESPQVLASGSGPRLHVFVRVINKDDAYDLKSKYLNGDPLLQEAGVTEVKLVRKQAFVPIPVQHVEQPAVKKPPPPAKKEKPKSLGCLKWGIILGVIGAIFVFGGLFLVGALTPVPATPVPNKPPTAIVARANTATPFVAPRRTSTSAPRIIPPTPTDTLMPVVAQPDCSNDFSSNINDWSYFFVDGLTYYLTDSHHDNDFYGIDNEGWYLFDIQRGNYWVYSICNTVDYGDVQIDVDAQNLGENDSSATIVCRYTPGVGLYEFNIFNDGQYQILFSDFNGTTITIADGGSNFIKTNNEINHYTAICQGNVFTLYVNGSLVKQARDDNSILSSGKIGLAEAYSDYPATVRFDYITVSQP